LDFSTSAISVSAVLNVLRNVLGNGNKSAQLKGVLVFEQRFLSEWSGWSALYETQRAHQAQLSGALIFFTTLSE
jgi:hypothetical protein